jgi:hypothetical protein
MADKKYIVVEEENNSKALYGFLVLIFCVVSLFIYEKYNWTWEEYPFYLWQEYVLKGVVPYISCVGESDDVLCERIKDGNMKKIQKNVDRILKDREIRIAKNKIENEEAKRKLKIKYGLMKDDSDENVENHLVVNNDMVDLRDVLSDYSGVGFKENRTYMINKRVISNKNFIGAISEISRTMDITITETTLGKHVVSEYSHSTGYKIDIRTKDLTYGEIGNIMKIFKKYDMLVAFEYDESEESQEIAEIISAKTSFKVRRSDNGEHIDVDLSKNSKGELIF